MRSSPRTRRSRPSRRTRRRDRRAAAPRPSTAVPVPEPRRCVRQTPLSCATLSRFSAVLGDQRRLYQSPPFVAHASVCGATSATPLNAGAFLIDCASTDAAVAMKRTNALAEAKRRVLLKNRSPEKRTRGDYARVGEPFKQALAGAGASRCRCGIILAVAFVRGEHESASLPWHDSRRARELDAGCFREPRHKPAVSKRRRPGSRRRGAVQGLARVRVEPRAQHHFPRSPHARSRLQVLVPVRFAGRRRRRVGGRDQFEGTSVRVSAQRRRQAAAVRVRREPQARAHDRRGRHRPPEQSARHGRSTPRTTSGSATRTATR